MANKYYNQLPQNEKWLIDRAILFKIAKLIKRGKKAKDFALTALTMDSINTNRENMAQKPLEPLYERHKNKQAEWSDEAQAYFNKLTPQAIGALEKFYHA